MTKISPLEKETQFLYNKHNKTTKFPLEIEEIEFPPQIIKILEKSSIFICYNALEIMIYKVGKL